MAGGPDRVGFNGWMTGWADRGRVSALVAAAALVPTLLLSAPPVSAAERPVSFGLAAANEAQLQEVEDDLGIVPAMVGLFADFVDAFPSEAVSRIHARGASALIALEPWDSDVGEADSQPAYALRSIVDGSFDNVLLTWFAAAAEASAGGPILVRFAPEMNGDWRPWGIGVHGNTSADFVAAWRHVQRLAAIAGADRLRWVWNPSVGYEGSAPLGPLYPGAKHVDLVALDGYNWGRTREWSRWQSFSEVFAPTVQEIRRIAPDKPWGIAETASASTGGNKATWIRRAYPAAQRLGARFLVWFNFDKETDWRLQQTPATTRAARQIVGDPDLVHVSPVPLLERRADR